LLTSVDSGRTWAVEHLPVEDLGCSFDVVRLPVVWVQCATGMMSGIWRSSDDGRSFAQPAAREGSPSLPNSAVFAAASDSTAIAGFQDIERTTDAGRHWHVVGPKPRTNIVWSYLGFTDAAHGVGIVMNNAGRKTRFALWATSDAGAHWRRVQTP
jgi:photosystem II stability/assembly factor-like uncharacterized protein